MIIDITPEQVVEMAKLAILASRPVGLGYLHFNPNLQKEEIQLGIPNNRALSIDYYQGRMVKFYARPSENGKYEFNDTISTDYQSWKTTYDSYQTLADKVKGE